MQPDVILTNGQIHVGTDFARTVDSVSILGGRIVEVGPYHEASRGPQTEVIDLHGHTVLPGFIDSHTHFCKYGLNLSRINLDGVTSVEKAVESVRQSTAQAAPGEWISGYNWDQHTLGRWPTRQDLDRAAPDNPVVLTRRDVHVVWANSKALEIVGINSSTPDTAGGQIDRNPEDGTPTGIVRETAISLLLNAVPKPTREDWIAAIERARNRFQSFGVTSVHTMEGLDEFTTLTYLRQRGELGLRFHTLIAKQDLDHFIEGGLRTGFGDEWIRVGPVKVFLDGTLGSQTAEMIEPFEGTSTRGIVFSADDEVGPLVKRSVEAGISVAMHAIGDGAVRRAIGHFEQAPPSHLRHRIEHVQLVHPDDLPRLRRLNLIGSVQPMFVISDFDVAYKYWGSRTRYAYAFKTIRDSGMHLAFGSDCPVEIPSVINAIDAACNRCAPDGRVFHKEERVSIREAIQAFTIGGAYAAGEEHLKGSIEPGKLADFTVLSEDPFKTSNIKSLEVLMTILGGKDGILKDLAMDFHHKEILKRYAQAATGRAFAPILLNILVTSVCDMRCVHCFFTDQLDDKPRKKLQMTTRNIEQISETLGANLGVLIIAGGEPFTRKDLPEVARAFYTNNHLESIYLMSNGQIQQRIIPDVTRILQENPNLNVTVALGIDGLKEDHEKIRQKPGSWDIAIDTARKLQAIKKEYPRLDIQTCTCFMNSNQARIFEWYDFLKYDLKPDKVNVNYIRPPSAVPEELNIEKSKYDALAHRIADDSRHAAIKNRYSGDAGFFKAAIDIYMHELIAKTAFEGRPQLQCFAGTAGAVIYDEGTISSCEILAPVGNLRDYDWDFSKLWYSAAMEGRRETVANGCFCTHESNCYYPSLPFNPGHLIEIKRLEQEMKDVAESDLVVPV